MKLKVLENGVPNGAEVEFLPKATGEEKILHTKYGDITILCEEYENRGSGLFGPCIYRGYILKCDFENKALFSKYNVKLQRFAVTNSGEEIWNEYNYNRIGPSEFDLTHRKSNYGEIENYYAQAGKEIEELYGLFTYKTVVTIDVIARVLTNKIISCSILGLMSHRDPVTSMLALVRDA